MTHRPEQYALGALYDAALWALTPQLRENNAAAYDALDRAIKRARPFVEAADSAGRKS
jgi:hypothetical protein